jgi:hypothetical protein
MLTWGEFKQSIKKHGVQDSDVIAGFRWFNDAFGRYYVTVWFDGKKDGITLFARGGT